MSKVHKVRKELISARCQDRQTGSLGGTAAHIKTIVSVGCKQSSSFLARQYGGSIVVTSLMSRTNR